jgi:NADPH-dependent ferric siderophore reductase
MRPYYVKGVEQRLKNVSPTLRRVVLTCARIEAIRKAEPGDVQSKLYAVLPHHLAEFGISMRQSKPTPPHKLLEREFMEHMIECNPKAQPVAQFRQFVKQQMKWTGTQVCQSFQHFKAGWTRRANVEL